MSLVQTVELPSPALFRAVLAQGAQTNFTDADGNTLLMLAAKRHHVTALAALLAAGLDVNARNTAGNSALAIAAGKSEYELMVVGIGLALGPDQASLSRLIFRPAQKSNESAATARRLEASQLLLAARPIRMPRTTAGDTPLLHATRSGDAELVALLIAAGAKVDARNESGNAPLLFAAQFGMREIAATLLDAHADAAVIDGEGRTPLQLARAGGHEAIVKLLEAGRLELIPPRSLHARFAIIRRECPPAPAFFQFHTRTLLIASGLIAALLLTAVLAPQFLARNARLQVLRDHVSEVARLAASQVDGDLHRQLAAGHADEATAPPGAGAAAAAAPGACPRPSTSTPWRCWTAARISSWIPRRMRTSRGAAASPPSKYMEPFEQRREYPDDWLPTVSAGKTYVNPGFQYDDYGYFLSGNAPILDSSGAIAGLRGRGFRPQLLHDPGRALPAHRDRQRGGGAAAVAGARLCLCALPARAGGGARSGTTSLRCRMRSPACPTGAAPWPPSRRCGRRTARTPMPRC